jgi:biofilm PGA synthesis N-glycosyltransferase PgaC
MAAVVFWSTLALVIYTYVGYGGLMWLLARLRPRPRVARPQDAVPLVTVIVVAHDEGSRIQARLENLLALDYPAERLEIIAVSDGSQDETEWRARRFEPRVHVIACPVRRGKPAVLNEVIPQARGEIVVLADARQRFDKSALWALVRGFADPTVGAVSGELLLLKHGETEAAVEGTALYWDYEKLIRWSESRVDSAVGATGAIYALRRALFEPIPADTVLDDVLIPMTLVRHGYRVLFEPAARAYDWRVASSRDEFRRKVRTLAGNFQLFASEPWLLNPRMNRIWFQMLSHKGMRLILPVLYAALIISNLCLIDARFYQFTLMAEASFVFAACAGYFAPPLRRAVPLLVVPYAVCFLTWATIVAFVRFASGRQPVTWERKAA